ncbi:MAG: carbohydrate binding domain-containing protein [Bryobacterales bacterium]|nr:carbohydrate binding domain-containing protein [Bryobacterales bacterium]
MSFFPIAAAWLFAAGLSGADFYVAPSGLPSGDGSIGRPWDLATALAHPPAVKPGDTIWLRGGTYGTGGGTRFITYLAGTASQPIKVRQYAGERAVVDGGIDSVGPNNIKTPASYTWYWGFEITNSSQLRYTSQGPRPPGINLHGVGHKLINLLIHDAGHPGIGFWNQGDGGEIYGCIVYGNGIYDGSTSNPWIRGSGVYTQNNTGTVYITNSIWFKNFTTGINAYGEGGSVKGYNAQGNISFMNDSADLWFATIPKSTPNPIERLSVIGNYTFQEKTGGQAFQAGYKGDNKDAVVKDNYFVGGHNGTTGLMFLRSFQTQTVTGNTVIGESVLADDQIGSYSQSSNWNSNKYYGGGQAAGRPFHYYNSQTGSDQMYTFDNWKSMTKFDSGGSYGLNYPMTNKVVIVPNKFEAGRAHIAIYNWEMKGSVSVDLSSVLAPGTSYKILDVQNLSGAPVASGTYQGGTVSLPMNLSQITHLVGTVTHMPDVHSSNTFGIYLLLPNGQAQTPPPPPPPPGGTSVVVNGSFESGLQNWVSAASPYAAVTTATAQDGKASLQLKPSSQVCPLAYQQITVTGGKSYDLSVWMKASNITRGAAVNLSWRNASGAVLRTDTVTSQTGTFNWKQILKTVTAPSGAAWMNLILYANTESGSSPTAYYDNVSFIPR